MPSNQLLIILGAPGSGKGTQTNQLFKNGEYNSICMGDIVRSEILSQTPFAKTMQSYLDKGDLVPDSLICDLFSSVYKTKKSGKQLILDGFPRTLLQCKHLEEITKSDFPLKKIIFINVPNDILVQRLLDRKRSDDTKTVILNRLNNFKKEIDPILNYFNNDVIKIDGNNSIDLIYRDIISKIK
jgi:adenylate kinase